MEAPRQHVLEEAAHEFVAAQMAGSWEPGLAFLILDSNGFITETDNPGIGESDAKDVTGEVVEHRLFAGAPGGDVEDPWCAPHRIRDAEIRALAPQQCPELAAHQFGESLDGHQELPACRMPRADILGDPAAADQAMNMRVQVQLLCPEPAPTDRVCSTASTPTVPPT